MVSSTLRKETIGRSDYRSSSSSLSFNEKSGLFRSLIDESLNGVFIETENLVYVNKKLCSMLGYSREELLSRDLLDSFEMDENFTVEGETSRTTAQCETPSYMVKTRRGDGTVGHYETFGTAVFFEDNQAELWTVIDRNERHDSTQRDFRKRKLEALGNVYTEMSHEVRNLIQPSLGYLEMAQRTGNPIFVDKAAEQVRRIYSVLERVLDYSRKDKYVKKEMEVGSVLTKSIEDVLLNEGTKYTVQRDFSEDTRLIADSEALSQVFHNILRNSIDAMPDGGKLYLSAHNVEIFGQESRYEQIPNGNYMKIILSDEGQGIPEESLVRIFEPFFTTKGEKGNGIGLAAVWNIVKNHDGFIDVKTASEGTTFELYFPQKEKELQSL